MARAKFEPEMTVAAVPETVDKPTRLARMIFCRLLATLLKAGIPLPDALETAAKDSTDEAIRKGASVIFDALVLSGRTLPAAIQRCPNFFEDLHVGLIRSGWETGRLDIVFSRIADVDEMLDGLHKRMVAALVQPAFILSGVLLCVVLAPKLFVPHVRSMLAESGLEMPAFSRAVFAFSDVVGSGWFWLGLVAFTLWLRYRWEPLFRREPLQRALYKLCYRIPGLSVLLKSVLHAHFARVVSMQLEAGTRLLDTLQNLQHGLHDPVFCRACRDVSDAIKLQGCSLAEGMEKCGYFDKTMVAMVAVGEETGDTAEMLAYVAKVYEEELYSRIDTWEKLMTPILLMFSGAVVCVWVLAVLLPLGKVIGEML
jgi:type IV pilus assembly protein PilC